MTIPNCKTTSKAALKKYTAYVRRKLLIAWSTRVRARDQNKCAICGDVDHINAHHLLAKESYHHLAYELDNGVSLCPSCHKFGRLSAHKNSVWFASWLMANRAEQWSFAVAHMQDNPAELTTDELQKQCFNWGVKIKVKIF